MPGLTKGHDIFIAFHENAFNKVLHALFTQRPQLFQYATPVFLALATHPHQFTPQHPLDVPGAGTMDYQIIISEPKIDFSPQSNPLPATLTMGADQFSLLVDVTACINCIDGQQIPDRIPRANPVCASLHIAAVGEPVISVPGPETTISLKILHIDVRNVGDLEKILDCFATRVLNAIINAHKLTLRTLALNPTLTIGLAEGPIFEDNQLKVWGNIN